MKLCLLLVILCAVLGLAACGQEGPLYLPDDKPPQKTQINNHNVNNKTDNDLDVVE